jgi:23S rRNA (uracil1939-C5)-methyltransferase
VPWLDREGLYSIADLLGLLVLDRLRPQPDDVVVDAYCGVGTFTALLAPRVREVIGIDESKAAIKDAVRNTADLPNVRFVPTRTEDGLAALTDVRVDGVVLDPARVGCSPAVISALLERRPRRVVYVSCDPATLARDLRLLREGGYRIEQVEPLDMFPQTYHIEMVTTLSQGGAASSA